MNGFSRSMLNALAALSRAMPPFRGKVRASMLAFKLLDVASLSDPQYAVLSRPVKHHMKLDLRSWMQRLAYVEGGYEPSTVEFLLALSDREVSQGYLIDVGACIGAIAIPYAVMRRGQLQLTVIAFEAVSDNVELLRENIALNDLDEAVHVQPIALGDQSKNVDIQVEGNRKLGEGAGTANILADGSDFQCVRQSIRIHRLDDIDLPRGCGVIKIDTDGYDFKVLQGAESFLQRERPIILGEFSAHCMRWHGQSVVDVERFCEALGFHVFARTGDKFLFSKRFNREAFDQDLLLVPEEKVKSISPWLTRQESAAQ